MKTIKMLALLLALLAALAILVSFFLPHEAKVVRSRKIKASPETIFFLVNNLHLWDKWSPWNRLDSGMLKTYEGPSSGVGASYSWNSSNRRLGKGNMRIVNSSPYDSICLKIQFGEMGTSDIVFLLKPGADGCTVSWVMHAHTGTAGMVRQIPLTYFLLLLDRMVGPDLEKGLELLEKAALASPAPDMGKVLSVSETEESSFHYISMEEKVPMNKIGAALSHLYGQMNLKLHAEHLQMAGPPMAVYPSYHKGDSTIRVVAMMQTDKPCTASCGKDLSCGTMPASHCLLAVFKGPYNRTQVAYDSLWSVMRMKQFLPSGDPREVYMNDPATVKSPADYLTYIYLPVRRAGKGVQ